jgi:hypothetical protein
MMQTAKTRQGQNAAALASALLRRPAPRRFFPKAKMRQVLVIIADIVFHEAFQMVFVKHDHMAEQVPAAVADEAFRDSVLPRALKARSLRTNTKALDRINHIVIEARAAIEDQIARCRVVRTRFPQLLDYPRTRRVAGHVEVKNIPALMRDHEEAVKHAERGSVR